MTNPMTNQVELLKSDDFAQYMLHDPREIRQILRKLVEQRALITTYLASGDQSFVTAILDVFDDQMKLVFDASPDEAVNRRVAATDELICATQLDGIKVQFPLDDIEEVTYQGRDAFRADMPDRVLRLQRREYFRLVAPITHELVCHIPVPQDDGEPRQVEARVLDISGGGVAISAPLGETAFTAGATFEHCRISFPDFGPIPLRLKVRNVFPMTNRAGVHVLRVGCQFIDLPSSANNVIQRYIFKVERDRSARDHGY